MTVKEFKRLSHSWGAELCHKYTCVLLSVPDLPQAVSFEGRDSY